MTTPVTRPFQLNLADLADNLEQVVDITIDDMTSQFLLLPRGENFLEYTSFRRAYEILRKELDGFSKVTAQRCWRAAKLNSLSIVVLRTILGFTPPEWAEVATELTGTPVPTGWMRTYDRSVRDDAAYWTGRTGTNLQRRRTDALFETACELIEKGAGDAEDDFVHRLDKFDTSRGTTSLLHAAASDVPYAVVLYERYLGRPFASHRDAVSELVGDVMETAIEDELTEAKVPFRKTKRAERVPNFEQAPDFFIPDEVDPRIIIEAKITSDDGTARDKVARILRLAAMRDRRRRDGKDDFQVIACIDGRGFTVRRQDLRDLITRCEGKVFTANSIRHLVAETAIRDFAL